MAEVACEIDAGDCLAVVQLLDRQQPAGGLVADEELLQIPAYALGADKGIANRYIVNDGVGREEAQRAFDVEGVGAAKE